ncbi:hypothetical protein QG516_20955 [Pedobacter gandavensis]|uniref:hypothetical protein n=1 Tax=Pedobacter gandavensis TaxID=2679963 RepID=UPI00247870C5|nr:hypothetical protein [Pedobacter gandavensis]WGQ08985.1 hypothetical protein QG516_20955 [Pedobacter gandavensis]
MFRKIPSSNNSDATLGTELKKEFGKYFKRVGLYSTHILNKYPLTFFSLMVASILLSGVLSFTVMRIEKPSPIPSFPKSATNNSNGVSEIIGAFGTLKEATILQSRIEILAHKDTLNAADSIEVLQSLKRIDQIRKTMKLKSNQ